MAKVCIHIVKSYIPYYNAAVHSTRAESLHALRTAGILSNRADGILMHSPQLGIILCRTSLQIHLSEHVQRAFVCNRTTSRLTRPIKRASNRPAILTALQTKRFTIIPSRNDLTLGTPYQRGKRQHLRADTDDRQWRLLRRRRIHDGDAAVVGCERERIATGAERDAMHPASSIVQILAADGVERQTFTPDAWRWALIDALDEAAEDARVTICAAGSEQDAVRMPGDGRNGAADRLLQMLGHPPVVLGFEVADGDSSGAGADGEFGLVGRPASAGSGTIEAQENERGLVASGGRFPDVGIAILKNVRRSIR